MSDECICQPNVARARCGFCVVRMAEDIKRLSCLAHNLAIAGALCRAFDLGQRFEEPFPLGPRDMYPPWRPGDGRSVL